MKKDDLKNGYRVELSNMSKGWNYYFLEGSIIKKNGEITEGTSYVVPDDLNNPLKVRSENSKTSILSVFNHEDVEIWRKIEWDKVPIKTKVLFRDTGCEVWKEGYFVKFRNNVEYPYYVMYENMEDIKPYRHCKLVEIPPTKNSILDEFKNEYCEECVDSKGEVCANCLLDWVSEKYDFIRK